MLVIMVFLVYRNNILSEELETARTALAAVPSNAVELNDTKIELERANERIETLEREIEWLQSSYVEGQDPNAGNGTGTGTGTTPTANPATPPPTATSTPTPAPTPSPSPSGLPTEYVVESGDSLSRIARRYYGSDRPADIDRIKAANNLTSDNIRVGQRLVIPAP
jgi:LysM repeat protein